MKISEINKKTTYPIVYYGKYIIPGSYKPFETYVQYPMEWLVLETDIKNKKALLLARFSVDWEGFADCQILSSQNDTSWGNSYLRNWLNDEFYNTCFSSEERDAICATNTESENGRPILDNVFLLSEREVKKYFKNEQDAIAMQAMVMDISTGKKDDPIVVECEAVPWWTRTLGKTNYNIVCVDRDGTLFDIDSNCDEIGVRPAFWVKIE